MKIIQNIVAFLILALLLAACAGSKKSSTASNETAELEKLATMMCGSFSSQAQSLRDTDFFDIRLQVCRIWAADKANVWLYVEQATAKAPERPYRQRIYKLESDGAGRFKSIIYTLPEEKKWAGAWKTPASFDAIKPGDLSLRNGCTVFLQKMADGTYSGSTHEADCESSLRGAKYATTKVTIAPKLLKSWDQGFNNKGEQVWGATKGGYEFLKL